jgi:ferric enterobactin receptor
MKTQLLYLRLYVTRIIHGVVISGKQLAPVMIKRPTFLILLLTLCFSRSLAQTPAETFSVKGIVTDSVTQQPVDFVTATLKNAAKQPVHATLTKNGGAFVFDKLPAGKYSITLVSIGYNNKLITVALPDNKNKVADLGRINLSSHNKQLKDITISADKPMVKMEADRIVYDLQADPESKVNSVLEMMRKVPLLSLDGEDNILLKGNANYKILINGKPSSMVDRDPRNILRSMPASTIERIEVITTPPAKYDAEGLAGIINIITTKKIDNGYNGSVNLNERFPVGGPGIGGSFTFKQGKFGMSIQSGGNIYNAPQTTSTMSRITTGADATNLTQNGVQQSGNHSGYLGTELSYELDTLNLISGHFNVNGNRSSRTGDQSTILNGQTGLLEGYSLANLNNGTGSGMDASLNYQLGFKHNKAQLLTFSYRFLKSEDTQYGALDVSDPVNYVQPDYHQNNDATSTEHTFQVDYVQPVKKLTIEMGVKGIMRTNKSDFEYQAFDAGSGEFETDPLRSNLFDNVQDVYSAYNSYQYTLKNWDFKAGIRLEATDFSSGQFKRNYFNLIPSISVNRKLKNNNSINFGFSQRIQRPGIYQLNPFVDRSNPNFYSTGNPYLNPMLANNYSVGFNSPKKVSVNIIASYTTFRSLIMPAVTYDSISHITYSGYQNTGSARLWGLNLNVNYNFTKRLNASINANVAHGWVNGIINGVMITNQGFMEHSGLSTGYKFDSGWRLNGNLYINGPDLSLQGTSSWNFYSSLSVNKDIVKNKLSFSAACNNPFAKYTYYRREYSGPDFIQQSISQSYYRSFTTSLNYRFGKLKDSIKKNKVNINNDDVSNSAQ